MSSRFLAAIEPGPLILDAAMGTRLCARGLDLGGDDPCVWNLSHPEAVLDLHRRDVAAGARAVFTNTFGANGPWLARPRFHLASPGWPYSVEAINRSAVALARQAVGPERFVVGSIGPAAAEVAGAAGEQAAVLVAAGVDALVLETYRGEAAHQVLQELQDLPLGSTPVLVSLWEWPEPMETTARRLLDQGAAILGMNCQDGIAAALRFAARLGPMASRPLLVKPSVRTPAAGTSPASFAAAVGRLLECRVGLLGGCCGTTEAHVAALAATCRRVRPGRRAGSIGAAP